MPPIINPDEYEDDPFAEYDQEHWLESAVWDYDPDDLENNDFLNPCDMDILIDEIDYQLSLLDQRPDMNEYWDNF